MTIFQRSALFLSIIGALNWGCIGLFKFDPIATLFGGTDTFLARSIYVIVGLAGLTILSLLWTDFSNKKHIANIETGTPVNS